MEAMIDAGVPNFALAEYKAPENYPAADLPALSGRCADHDLLTSSADLQVRGQYSVSLIVGSRYSHCTAALMN